MGDRRDMEPILITLEPRRSPINMGTVYIIDEYEKHTCHTIKRMPGFRGAAFYNNDLFLASPKSVRRFNNKFQVIDRIYIKGMSELHTIRVNLLGIMTIVSTNQNKVYSYDIKENKHEVIFQGWSGSHLNTLDGIKVMSLHGKVVDMSDGTTVWESDIYKKTHNYTKTVDGSHFILSENKVIKNGKVFYEEEGRFMRGLLIRYPYIYVGVNSFIDREDQNNNYKQPKVVMFSLDGEIIKEFEIQTHRPWVIYDIIKHEW